MPKTINMPEVLAGAAEATINEWFKQVGDAIAVGEPLAEIETEKAVVEYEAEEAGTVARLLVEPGETVTVGTPMLLLALEGEDAGAIASGSADADADASAPRADPLSPPPITSEGSLSEGTVQKQSDPWRGTNAPLPETSLQAAGSASTSASRRFASPLARRLAREHGIELARVKATGPGGRIVRRDIDRAVLQSAEDAAATADVAAGARAGAGAGAGAGATDASDQSASIADAGQQHNGTQPQTVPAPSVVTHPVQSTPQSPGNDAVPDGATAVPLTGMRRAIARRLTESKTQVPHFYLDVECRVDRLLALRGELNESIAADDRSRRVSVNDLIVKAAALALRDVPEAHVLWDGDRLLTFDQVDVAVAVAIDGGLVTPVVRGVDRLSIGAVHESVRDLAERARAGRTAPADLVGGTLAVSNLGMYGTRRFSAILNPPQSAIIAVGAAYRKPLVVDDQIEIGTVIECTLSVDHRAIDGAVAAQLGAAFQRRIESPLSILG